MTRTINDGSYWREFEKNDITHSAAHYLMAIDSLRNTFGYARVTDVADMLDACKMEHLMSLETGRRLVWLMRYILNDEERAAQVNEAMQQFRPTCDCVEECPLCADADECLAVAPEDCEQRQRIKDRVN